MLCIYEIAVPLHPNNTSVSPEAFLSTRAHLFSHPGKSTLLKLALRFYAPQGGSLELDGRRLDAIPEAELRRLVTWLPQEPPLFPISIRDNIAYGSGEGAAARGTGDTYRSIVALDSDLRAHPPLPPPAPISTRPVSQVMLSRDRLARAPAKKEIAINRLQQKDSKH